MERPYQTLRRLFAEHKVTAQYVAEKIGMNESTLSKRLMDKVPFTQTEMYAIMDLFQVNYERMPELFPKNGEPYTPVRKSPSFRIVVVEE